MKIVVIGGTGLIGSKLVADLAAQGHDAVPASPHLGINTITGEGLVDALAGASVVVDVSNSPSFDYAVALPFFETSTGNLVRAAASAGVGHLVALSVVGTAKLARGGDLATTTAGYFAAKQRQETLIASSRLPFTIVHATQFYEFIKSIADVQTTDGVVRVPPVAFQPMAAADVATALARIASGAPARGLVEVGGPDRRTFEAFMRSFLTTTGDARGVVGDPAAGYYGIAVDEGDLVPADGAHLGQIRFEDWLQAQATAGPVRA
jgi:uncharacterized protein YbjT (DUF2867 family)